MNIKEAIEELSRRYPDRYVSVSYTIDRYFWEGEPRDSIVCSVFRGAGNDPMGQLGKGHTWKEALENLNPPDLSCQDEPCDDGEPRRSELDLDQIAYEERLEDARNEAVVIRREMEERGKV